MYTVLGVLVVAIASVAFLKNVEGESLNTAAVHTAAVQSATQVKSTAAAAATKAAAAKKAADEKTKAQASASSTTTSPATTAPATPVTAVVAKPKWTSLPLVVDPNNSATSYATANPNLADVSKIARMGQQSVARWFGGWDANVNASVNSYTAAASASGSAPVLVLYNIPNRDCGSYSAGGSGSSASYLQWVRQAAAGIGSRNAVVILEPDALAGADCLSADGKQDRYATLSQAVAILKAQPNTAVYLDGGNPTWQSADTIAARLKAANIALADGFSLNVSNYISTNSNVSYGEKVSQLVGGKHYVIDTSRSGGASQSAAGPFNVPGAALGQAPTTHGATARNDAYLWVKVPWESDGPVNGGPAAGQPYWSYAIQLAKNAGW